MMMVVVVERIQWIKSDLPAGRVGYFRGKEGSSAVKPVKISKTGWKSVGHRRRGVDVMVEGGGTFGFYYGVQEIAYVLT